MPSVMRTSLRSCAAPTCVPDGVGVLWAASLLGAPLPPDRVTGSDGIYQIAVGEFKDEVTFLGAGQKG